MASATPGTGATLKATSVEGQCIESILFLLLREANSSSNPNGANNLDASIDADTGFFSGSFRLPAAQTLNASGQLVINAVSYLNGVIFTPGVDGTFKSATCEGYALEVLMSLQALEQQPTKNPQNRNYVTGSYNSDTKVFTGTFTLPVTLTLEADGSVKLVANPYLID